jgi:hypothetical protein
VIEFREVEMRGIMLEDLIKELELEMEQQSLIDLLNTQTLQPFHPHQLLTMTLDCFLQLLPPVLNEDLLKSSHLLHF